MLLNTRLSRFLVTRLSRAYGFLDPIALLGQLRGFARPSEVGEPIELLRAGMLFHARGLLNTKAIQHNLDWVWPYWVEQQFNPDSRSFIPRAFSFSHINLTHRNWTAVGLPDIPFYPIIDPRGLVTPLYDGWSLDFWLLPDDGAPLLPSKLEAFHQEFLCQDGLEVKSRARGPQGGLTSTVTMALAPGGPECRIRLQASVTGPALLAVALRPYNPEGVSFVEKIEVVAGRDWRVNKNHAVHFDRPPARHVFSNYEGGDALLRLREPPGTGSIACSAGLATALALFPTGLAAETALEIRVPIFDELEPTRRPEVPASVSWSEALAPLARLEVPDPALQRLWNQAAASIVLHVPLDAYPGPYTYKRFWFRDAVFILHALLALGDVARVRRSLERFAPRQRRDGYFLSQEGEWDSNGEVLWFYARFARFTAQPLPDAWLQAVARGARWITRKRLPAGTGRREAGLLPAGFSAEHLGPNDFYYWDDFWAVAGLRGAAELLTDPRHASLGTACAREAEEFLATIVRSFPAGPHRRFPGAIPASPYRRMDSGAVGSVVADYPLQLFPPGDPAMMKTVDFLQGHCFRRGAFFQDMIHSGLNVYLTLHLAQARLRAGQAATVWPILDRVAELASPTGQWPEAIHPLTGGGCMGDGQHIWAAAEWLLLLRHLVLREEGDTLVLGAGVNPAWLRRGRVALGPVLTPHGTVTVTFTADDDGVRAHVAATWRRHPPAREFRIPGCAPLLVPAGNGQDEFHLRFLP